MLPFPKQRKLLPVLPNVSAHCRTPDYGICFPVPVSYTHLDVYKRQASVNENIRKILPELLKEFQVIHLCGKGKMDESLKDTKGYVQYEYIKQELADLFALSDIVISRAGANAICELNACLLYTSRCV